jgi:CelD/BcsL family acetyltransferase involved in cellulose biosynthesis
MTGQVRSGVRVLDRIEPLVSEWEHLARSTGASPFLWPGWFGAWWRAFGRGRLRLITVYEDGQLVGVLPLRKVRGTLSSTTNYHTPLFGFLAANEIAASHLSRALFSQRTHRVDLSFLSPTDSGVSLACVAAKTARYKVLTESKQVAPYVDTRGAWEDYEGGLRRKFRSELRRRRRRLEEEGQLTLEVSDGTQKLSELLEEGFQIEDSGWKGAGQTSINSHRSTRRFYTEVAHWAAEHDWLRLAFLRLDGRGIAFDYCLEHNGVHYLLKTGFDPAYRQYAPGMIIRHLMLARAFSNDISTYNFLGADYGWKREWTDVQQGRLFLRMFAPTVPGFLGRMGFTYGRPAAKRVKNFADSALDGLESRLLRRGYAMLRARLSR